MLPPAFFGRAGRLVAVEQVETHSKPADHSAGATRSPADNLDYPLPPKSIKSSKTWVHFGNLYPLFPENALNHGSFAPQRIDVTLFLFSGWYAVRIRLVGHDRTTEPKVRGSNYGTEG